MTIFTFWPGTGSIVSLNTSQAGGAAHPSGLGFDVSFVPVHFTEGVAALIVP